MASSELVIVGGGPGGYVAAIRAAQLGLEVACVEMEETLGGTCVRVGCIPSKALLESSERFHEAAHGTALADHGVRISGAKLDLDRMLARKDEVVKANTDGVAYLFRKNNVKRYRGKAVLTGPGSLRVEGADDAQLEARHIVLATGSRAATLPGVEIDGERIVTSTEALDFRTVPKELLVIGAGYIGLELGSVWSRLGSKVTVLEYLDRILPGMDAELAREALKAFRKQGLEFRLGSRVTGARAEGKRAVVELAGGERLQADKVLVAVGRAPNSEGLGLEELGVELNERGFVKVDESFRTNVPGLYAIGDVIGGAMLAHKAEEEGIAVVEMLAGRAAHVDYGIIPGIVYTSPEIATAGSSEEQLKEAGIEYRKGVFAYTANGRARAMGKTEGKVKVLADAATDRILGVHIIGERAGDLIAEAVAAMSFHASSEDLALTVHAHPTLSEIVREAALAVSGSALHV